MGVNLAFAAKSTISDTCIAVSFDKNTLPVGDNIKHMEISDSYATQLLKNEAEMIFAYMPDGPAFQRESDMKVITYLVNKIPQGGIIVEVGSALGGNAHFILSTAPHIGSVVCIEPDWKDNHNNILSEEWLDRTKNMFNIANDTTSFAFAKKLLEPYPQAELYPLISPGECKWWTKQVDMVFEDASHESELLRENIEFWYQFVKPGGIVAGHDYNDIRVSSEINKISKELGLKLEFASAVWWMIKP